MKLIFLSISIFFWCSAYTQPVPPVVVQQVTKSTFLDCHPYKEGLVALTKDGSIWQINTTDHSIILLPKAFTGARTIAPDRRGILWAVDSFSSVISLQDTGWKWEMYLAAPETWAICFDSGNNLFLFTSLGIYNNKTEMYYGTNRYAKPYRFSEFARSRYRPYYFYMDQKDDLWISHRSRRGQELYKFSTIRNTFTGGFKHVSGDQIKGITGNGKQLFVPMFDTYGMSAIYSIERDSVRRIHHPEYDTMNIGPMPHEEEYIGAAFYDKTHDAICYYSNLGLRLAKYNSRNKGLEKPTLLMPSQCSWTGYTLEERDFVMQLRKMFRVQDKIVWLHDAEGIFIFDGKEIYNIK